MIASAVLDEASISKELRSLDCNLLSALPLLGSLLQIAEYKGSWFYGPIGKIIDRNKQVFHFSTSDAPFLSKADGKISSNTRIFFKSISKKYSIVNVTFTSIFIEFCLLLIRVTDIYSIDLFLDKYESFGLVFKFLKWKKIPN